MDSSILGVVEAFVQSPLPPCIDDTWLHPLEKAMKAQEKKTRKQPEVKSESVLPSLVSLSEIFLAFDDGARLPSTCVNDSSDLKLSASPPISKSNLSRLFFTNALQGALKRMNHSKIADICSAGTNLESLLQMAYPKENSEFIQRVLRNIGDNEEDYITELEKRLGMQSLKEKVNQGPPQAFLAMAIVDLQINSLEYSISSASPTAAMAMLKNTCSGMNQLFHHMPLGSLCSLAEWEHTTIEKITSKLVKLGEQIGGGNDQISLLLLGLAVQRGSLKSAVAAIERLMKCPEPLEEMDPILIGVFERLLKCGYSSTLDLNFEEHSASVHVLVEQEPKGKRDVDIVHSPLNNDELNTRQGLHETADSIAVSADGKYLYICGRSVNGLMKIGSGMNSWGTSPTLPGRVYARNQFSMNSCYKKRCNISAVVVVKDRVLVLRRKAGSMYLTMDSYDESTLLRKNLMNKSTRHRLHMDTAFAEQFVPLKSNTSVDIHLGSKSGHVDIETAEDAVVAWCGNGSSWLSGSGCWYFETTIVTGSDISIGWATPAFFNAERNQSFDSAWMFKVYESCIIDEFGNHKSFGAKIEAGDVIGCAISIDSETSKVEISFSCNGNWQEPMGRAFEIDSPILFVRPVFLLQGGPASIRVLCGGVKEFSEENVLDDLPFEYQAPNQSFNPVAWNSGSGDKDDSDEDDSDSQVSEEEFQFDEAVLGPLPPICSDGRFIYLIQVEESLLPIETEEREVVVDILDPIDRLNLVKRKRFPLIAGFPDPNEFLQWKVLCNGDNILVTYDLSTEKDGVQDIERVSAVLHLGSVGNIWRERPVPDSIRVLEKQVSIPSSIDAAVFDRYHNSAWSWNEQNNTLERTENSGFVSMAPDEIFGKHTSASLLGDRVDLCSSVLQVIARLSSPLQPVCAAGGIFSSKLRGKFAPIKSHVLAITGKDAKPDASLDLFLNVSPDVFKGLWSLLTLYKPLKKNNALRNNAITACMDLLAVNLNLLDVLHRANPVKVKHSVYFLQADEVFDMCCQFIWDKEEPEQLQTKVATALLKCIDSLLPSVQKKVAFLSKDRIHSMPPNGMRLLSGILQSLAVDAVSTSFGDFIVQLKPVLADLLHLATRSTFKELDHIHSLEFGKDPVPCGMVRDSVCSLFGACLLTGFQSVDNADLGLLINQIFEQASSILESGCNVALLASAMPITQPRIKALSDVLLSSIVGRLVPTVFSWLEFHFRSNDRTAVTSFTMSLEGSLGYLAMLISQLLKLSSALGTNGESLMEKSVHPSKSHRKRRSTLVAAANTAVAQTTFGGLRKPTNVKWASAKNHVQVYESNHQYDNDTQEEWLVSFPGADFLVVEFDARTSTEHERDYLQFLADNDERISYGEPTYSGSTNWPGTGTTPALRIPADRFVCKFVTDRSDVDWGYKFTVRAHLLESSSVTCIPWFLHVSSLCQDLVASMVHAMLGSQLHDAEVKQLRWIQNPIMSGGLKTNVGMTIFTEQSTPLLSGRRLRNRSRAHSLTDDDRRTAETMLVDLLSDQVPPPNLGGALFKLLREKRVPMDQGLFTHRAAACMLASLIHVKGIEKEALNAAKASISGIIEPVPARLLRLWSACQGIRSWINDLVINNQVHHHIESSLPLSSSLRCRLLEMLSLPAEDPDETAYAAMCDLVAVRAQFLITELAQPTLKMLALRSNRQDAARARWHRLRKHFCPKTQNMIQVQKGWNFLLRGIGALSGLRRVVDRRAAQKMALPLSRTTRSLTRQRSVDSDGELRDRAVSWTQEEDKPRLQPLFRPSRSSSYCLESPMASPNLHSTKSSSTCGSTTSLGSKSSHFNFQGPFRRRERVSGGLRRSYSVSEAPDVDITTQEQEQSLAESVATFLQAASPVDTETLRVGLMRRNERATVKSAGWSFVNALLGFARSHHRYLEGKQMLETLLLCIARALRGFSIGHSLTIETGTIVAEWLLNPSEEHLIQFGNLGAAVLGNAIDANTISETHFLTDLAGCSASMRDMVSNEFYKFLHSVSSFLKLAVRQHEIVVAHNTDDANVALLSTELDSQIKHLLSSMSLDYVESDFEILEASDIVSALRSALVNGGSWTIVEDLAWKTFVLLVRRCVCESGHTGSRFTSGNSVQQSLLDVLVEVLEKSLSKSSSTNTGTIIHFKHSMVGMVGAPHRFEGSMRFGFSLTAEEHFSSGRLFSFGNPQVGTTSLSSHVAVEKPTVFSWIEVSVDSDRRLTVSSGDMDGVTAQAVSQFTISETTAYEICLRPSGTVNIITKISSGIAEEVFKHVFYETGLAPPCVVGDLVRILEPTGYGLCGTVIGKKTPDVCLVVHFPDEGTIVMVMNESKVRSVPAGSRHFTNSLNPRLKKLFVKSQDSPMEDQITSALERLDLSKVDISRALQLFRSNCVNDIDDDIHHGMVLLEAPLYMGPCPNWGMGLHRSTASHISLEGFTISPLSSLPETIYEVNVDGSQCVLVGEEQLESGASVHVFHAAFNVDNNEISEREPSRETEHALEILKAVSEVSCCAVGRSRLTAPHPMSLLLKTVLSEEISMQVRVASIRILEVLLLDVTPLNAGECASALMKEKHFTLDEKQNTFVDLVCRTIGEAFSLSSRCTSFRQVGDNAVAIAMHLVEMLHTLCAKDAWVTCISKWVHVSLSKVNSPSDPNALSDLVAALSALGGVYEHPRIGCRAFTVSDGFVSKDEVVILGRAPQEPGFSKWLEPEVESEITDISSKMKVAASSGQTGDTGNPSMVIDGNAETYWESNGYIPHWIQLTSPNTFSFHSISIHTNGDFESYSPEKIELRLGPTPENLRSIRTMGLPLESRWIVLVNDQDIHSTDRVFRMEITSNYSGGCDSRVRQFKIFGKRPMDDRWDLPTISVEKYMVRQVYGGTSEEESHQRMSDSISVLSGSELLPIPRSTPNVLLESLSVEAAQCLYQALQLDTSSLLCMDVRARASKVVSIIMERQRLVNTLGDVMLPFLLEKAMRSNEHALYPNDAVGWNISQANAAKLRISVHFSHPESSNEPSEKLIKTRERTYSLPSSYQKTGKFLTFEPAGKVDRMVSASNGPMLRGRFRWVIKLHEDTLDDETSLIGITSNIRSDSKLSLLKPCSDMWLIQPFSGKRIHKGVSSEWEGESISKIHPGDLAIFTLDMDKGVLSVSVNYKPFVRVFEGISKEAVWGVYPCVGSYGNPSRVCAELVLLECEQDYLKETVPFKEFMLKGSLSMLEARVAKLSTVLYEGTAFIKDTDGVALFTKTEPDVEPVESKVIEIGCESLLSEEEGSFGIDYEEDDGFFVEPLVTNKKSSVLSSQQMIQKINTLYEVVDVSSEQTVAVTKPVDAEHDTQSLSMAIISDPSLAMSANWVQRICGETFETIFHRYVKESLRSIVAEWSVSTGRVLPSFLLSSSRNCEMTLHLIFSAGKQSIEKARNAIMLLQDTDAISRFRVMSCNTFSTVGSLLNSVVSQKKAELEAGEYRSHAPSLEPESNPEALRSSSCPPVSPSAAAIVIGDVVNAMDAGQWKLATVKHVNTDGTYCVEFHHHPRFTKDRIPLSDVEPLRAEREDDVVFVVGERVVARFNGDVKWFPGRVSRVRRGPLGNISCDIRYEDGDFEQFVPSSLIKRSAITANSPSEDNQRPRGLSRQASSEYPLPVAPFTDQATAGNCVLIADRYRGDIPASGKADSAQVSIINAPVASDGLIKSVTLRLAEPPAGAGTWDVMVFQRAGETGTFFVVESTPSRPTHTTLKFDPHSVELQTVEIEGDLYIQQGQYLGVINPNGRLNVAYTPGKKKCGESWAVKPVEVFYLMPKDLKEPLGSGPNKTRKWHGRAGWCATMLVTAAKSTKSHPGLLQQSAENVLDSFTASGLTLEQVLVQSCWFLRLAVKEQLVDVMSLMSTPGFITAISKVLEYGVFHVEGDVDNSSSLLSAWLPVIELTTDLSLALVSAGTPAVSPLNRECTRSLFRLQAVLESKVNIMNLKGQRKGKDIPKVNSEVEHAEVVSDDEDGTSSRSSHLMVSGRTVVSDSREPGISSNNNLIKISESTQESSINDGNLTASVHFQRLLQCLVAIDDLTRKDGLDGEILIVDSPRRTGRQGPQRCEYVVQLQVQNEASPSVLMFEYNDGMLAVNHINSSLESSLNTWNDLGLEHNVSTILSQVVLGDELVAVQSTRLDDVSVHPVLRDQLVQLGINGLPRKTRSEQTTIDLGTDLSKVFVINGVTFPPMADLVLPRPQSLPLQLGSDVLELIFVRSGTDRQTSDVASSQGVSYKGVKGSIEKFSPCFAADETSLMDDSDWLDSLVTSTELLKAFAGHSLPPSRFLKEQYVLWSQRKMQAVLESEHPFHPRQAMQTLNIPNATALKIKWDSRSSVSKRGSESGAQIIVSTPTSTQNSLAGFGGYPPNISLVHGSTVSLSICNPSSEEEYVSTVIVGLQNRSGAYIWLGTKPGFRTKFFCGRPWSLVVGWAEHNGRCGPQGGSQCPDCAVFVPRNSAGNELHCGTSETTHDTKSQLRDLLYCKLCSSGGLVPCVPCRRFMTVLQRTKCMTDVHLKRRSDFESNVEYARYVSGIIVVGLYVRVTAGPSRLYSGIGMVLKISYSKLSCSLRLGSTTGDVPLHLVELLLQREFDGKDFRMTQEPAVSSSNTPQSAQLFPELSDFFPVTAYHKFMNQHCELGARVRCSRTYESVEEGDIGTVSRVDVGDDLPCQVMWESLGAYYWLPWEHLSLNEKPMKASSSASFTEQQLDDDLSVSFNVPGWVGDAIDVFSAGRSISRKKREGAGTQRVNVFVDNVNSKFVGELSVECPDLSNHIYLGVMSEHFANGDDAIKTPLNVQGTWSLRSDGALFVDGKETRGAHPPSAFKSADLISVSIDVDNSSLTFRRGEDQLLESITGIPGRVAVAATLTSSDQKVSLVRVVRGKQAVIKPIDRWGYRVVVQPLFDASQIGSDDTNDLDKGFQIFLSKQNSWTRKQDEILVSFVNDVVEKCALELPALFIMTWEDVLAISDAHLSCFENEFKSNSSVLTDLVKERSALIRDETQVVGLMSDILDDVSQRFDLIRALNKSVHDSLGLLDLSSWRTPGSSAAHLSECCALIFRKFKVPLWTDALTSTQAEDIHKFEVVLDFGRAASRAHFPDIHGRHTVFAQAFRAIHPIAPKTLRAHGKLYRCVMRGMASHDDGGPYRQSFTQYCAELQTLPGVGLLLPCSNRANGLHINRDRWLPNPSANSPVQISMFEFLGKLLGIAIRNNELLDLRLPSLVWKPLVNHMATVEDLRAVDLLTVTNCDPNREAFYLTEEAFFTVISLDGKEMELVPGGSDIVVNTTNFDEWSHRVLEFKLHEFDVQIDAMRRGLATIVPQKLLMVFKWDELELMVCGRPKLDLALLRKMTVYADCRETDSHVQFFWAVLEAFTEEQRSEYIKFVWGRARLPSEERHWEHMHRVCTLHAPRSSGRQVTPIDSMLPYAHTCYFTIDIPQYSSEEITRTRLLYAIENCAEIDGDQTTTGRRAAAMGFAIDDDDDNEEDDDDEYQDDDSMIGQPVPPLSGDRFVSTDPRLSTIREALSPGNAIPMVNAYLSRRNGGRLPDISSLIENALDLQADPFAEFLDGVETSSDVSSQN